MSSVDWQVAFVGPTACMERQHDEHVLTTLPCGGMSSCSRSLALRDNAYYHPYLWHYNASGVTHRSSKSATGAAWRSLLLDERNFRVDKQDLNGHYLMRLMATLQTRPFTTGGAVDCHCPILLLVARYETSKEATVSRT